MKLEKMVSVYIKTIKVKVNGFFDATTITTYIMM